MHTIQNAHLFRHSVVWRFVLKVPYAQKRKKLSHARITCSQSCKSPGSKAKNTTVAKEGLRIHEKGVVKAVQCCQNCLPDMDRWLRKKAGNQPHGNHTPSMRVYNGIKKSWNTRKIHKPSISVPSWFLLYLLRTWFLLRHYFSSLGVWRFMRGNVSHNGKKQETFSPILLWRPAAKNLADNYLRNLG